MEKETVIPQEVIMGKIYLVDDKKVMLDSDLAQLYQVGTRRLNEQVKRNQGRFPPDFMYQLTRDQWENLKSHFATSSWGGRRTLPYVFTEQGVAMLSSVLNSEVAIQVNIQIIRVFTSMREMLMGHQDILIKVQEMEKKLDGHDQKITVVFDYLKQFVREREKPRPAIGYTRNSRQD